jgi:hypothetical protein
MGSFGYAQDDMGKTAQDDKEATFFVILSGTQWSRRIPQTESTIDPWDPSATLRMTGKKYQDDRERPMGSFGVPKA